MATINGGTLVVSLEGKDVNLTDLLTRVERQMKVSGASAKEYDTTITRLSNSQRRNEAANAAYAQSLARVASAAGDDAQAIQLLGNALQSLTPSTAQANNVLLQLQQTLNKQANTAQQAANAQMKASAQAAAAAKAEAAAFRNSASFVTNFAQSFQGLIGAYFAVTSAAQAFNAVISAGNELEKTQVTFKALSGDIESYEKNLAAAKAQQARFGGSLNENIDALSGFANLAKRTGIDITQLANTARALAIIDPAQGFKGASIALKEFFSGDITSLARRFELPRDALRELANLAQTDAPAAFQKLEATLAEFGISQQLLAGQAETTAVAYDKLGGAAADAFAQVGQLLAQGLKPAAEQLTIALQTTAAGLNQLSQAGDKKLAVEDAFFAASTSADQFNAKVVSANAAIQESLGQTSFSVLGVITGIDLVRYGFDQAAASGLKFQQVTEAQFQLAQRLKESGASIEVIRTTMQATSQTATELENTYASIGAELNITKAQFDAFAASMLEAGQLGQDGAITAEAFFDALVSGSEGIDTLLPRLDAYIEGNRQATVGALDGSDAHERHAVAIEHESDALSQAALDAIDAEQASAALKLRQEELYSAALAAAQGLAGSGNAAIAMAQQFGIAEGRALSLINALRDLQIAKNLSEASSPSERNFVGVNALAGRSVDLKSFRDAQKALDGVNDAMRDQAFATADASGQLNLLRGELNKLTPGTEAYIRKQTELLKLEDQIDNKRSKKGGGAKSPKLSANDKLNNQLLAQQDKFNTQMEDLEEEHQQKLVDILAEFAKKQLEVQNENEKLKRRSRFDFYSDLNKSELNPIDRQAFAKAYEDAFAEAQRISQSGRAKLGQEFLALKQDHINQLKELAQEEQDIRTDDDLSGNEKNARLAELEARRKLLLDAQREEEKQLLEGGDSVQKEFQDRIDEENKAYADQADKIIESADRAGDAKIRNAERNKIVVDAENKALADQLLLYNQIAAKNGGTMPATGQPTATTPANIQQPQVAPQPISAIEPIPIKTDVPLSVDTPEAIIVKQLEMFIVRDQGVIDTIGDQTIRLEGKLDIVAQRIDAVNQELSSRLDALKGAVNASASRKAVQT